MLSQSLLILDQYVFNESRNLGQGSNGEVFRGYRKNSPKDLVAIKRIAISGKDPKILTAIQNEITSLHELDHSNIIEFIDYSFDDNYIYIIMEYCPNGDLRKLIESNGKLSTIDAMNYFKQIIEAMFFVNKKKYFHRDIKPANLLLLNKKTIKLADFGLARVIDPSRALATTLAGSFLYMAPEIYNNNDYSFNCDVWSTGLVLYEMLYGELPWKANYVGLLQKLIQETPLVFPKSPKIDPNIKDLIKLMLNKNPRDRPDFKDILNHKALNHDYENSDSTEEEKEPPKYLDHLKDKGFFFGKLSKKVKKMKRSIGLSKNLSKDLEILLKKCKLMSSYKIKEILDGNDPDQKKIPSKQRDKRALESFKSIYIPLYEEEKAKFLDIISVYKSKNKDFNKNILNEDLSESKQFKLEYKLIFQEFLEVFQENFDMTEKEMFNDIDIENEAFKTILKLAYIRGYDKLDKKFRFDRYDPFIKFDQKIDKMDRRKLVRKVKKYQKLFEKN